MQWRARSAEGLGAQKRVRMWISKRWLRPVAWNWGDFAPLGHSVISGDTFVHQNWGLLWALRGQRPVMLLIILPFQASPQPIIIWPKTSILLKLRHVVLAQTAYVLCTCLNRQNILSPQDVFTMGSWFSKHRWIMCHPTSQKRSVSCGI